MKIRPQDLLFRWGASLRPRLSSRPGPPWPSAPPARSGPTYADSAPPWKTVKVELRNAPSHKSGNKKDSKDKASPYETMLQMWRVDGRKLWWKMSMESVISWYFACFINFWKRLCMFISKYFEYQQGKLTSFHVYLFHLYKWNRMSLSKSSFWNQK